jgi:hypothetical protein
VQIDIEFGGTLLAQSLFAEFEAQHAAPARSARSCSGKLPSMSANWVTASNEGATLFYFWPKPPLDTFMTYVYYRLPSIPFV